MGLPPWEIRSVQPIGRLGIFLSDPVFNKHVTLQNTEPDTDTGGGHLVSKGPWSPVHIVNVWMGFSR